MFQRIFVAAAALCGAIVLAGSGSQAASFDCGRASTPTEHAICDNPQLSSLDDQTAGLYYTLISNGSLKPSQVSQVKSEQAQFLQRRNACGAGYNCLIDAYTSQIMYLNNMSGKGM